MKKRKMNGGIIALGFLVGIVRGAAIECQSERKRIHEKIKLTGSLDSFMHSIFA